MKRVIAIVLAAVLAMVGGGALYYFLIYKNMKKTGTGRVSSTSEDAVYVDSVRLLAGLDSGTGLIARYAGVVEPQETWEAKLEGDKTVKKTYVKEGDEVKVGDKLFTYDTSEDEDKLAQAQIDLERAEAELENQKFQLASWEKQKPKDNASDEAKLDYTATLLQYQTEVKTSEYEIRQAKQEIESLKDTLETADVMSELDGVVRKISNPNSSNSYYGYGSDSSDAYITVMAVGDYRVKGTINEQHINDLEVGDEILAFSRVDDQSWKGTISEIKTDNGDSNQNQGDYYGYDSGSDSGSTNYPFYVKLESSEGLLLGQHVYLEPDRGQDEHKDGIWIPEYYFEFVDGQAYVWMASEDNKLVRRYVEVGDFDEDLASYEVKSGLDGDDYITVPEEDFVEGLPVIYVEYGNDGMSGLEDVYYEDDYYDDGSFDDGSYYDEYDEFEGVWYDEGSVYYADDEDVWEDAGSFDEDGSFDDEDDEDENDEGDEAYVDEVHDDRGVIVTDGAGAGGGNVVSSNAGTGSGIVVEVE